MSANYLTHQHQARITVQVIIEDDSGALTILLWLFISGWQISRYLIDTVVNLVHEVRQLKQEAVAALRFTLTVFSIAITALAYGFRVQQ